MIIAVSRFHKSVQESSWKYVLPGAYMTTKLPASEEKEIVTSFKLHFSELAAYGISLY